MKLIHGARSILGWAAYLAIGILGTQPAWAGNISVVNGTGGGNYATDTTVHIWANPYENSSPERAADEPDNASAPARVFDRWVGDTSSLADIYSSHTALAAPESDITVTATFKNAPKWTPPRLLSHFPANHRAVIFMFHGRGGSAENVFGNTEKRSFISEAISRGYGVVALDSLNRVDNQWSKETTVAGNPDLQRVAQARQDLIARGDMSAQDPVYVVGISNGGVFASLFDQNIQEELNFPVEAAALYISPGSVQVIASTEVPTIFLLGENDSDTINGSALNAYNFLLGNGVPTQLWQNPEAPLHPDRFWRIAGMKQSDSRTIHAALNEAGLLDANGFLELNPAQSQGWASVIPSEYLLYQYEIGDQLTATYAEHAFMSEFNNRTLTFFDNPVTVDEEVPQIINFEPTSGGANTAVVLTGQYLANATAVRFNRVDAVILGKTSTNIWTIVPDGATSGLIEIETETGSAKSASNFVVPTPPVFSSFSPTSGKAPTVVSISGSGFTGATAVEFGGVSASFTVDSDSHITATVPAGARSGKIRVTTPNGYDQAPSFFRVR